MKVSDLLEIHEDQFLVVANNPRNFHLGIIDWFDVAINYCLKVLSKLFLRFHQLTNDSSKILKEVRLN